MPQVTEINVYPIKSCGRIARTGATVLERGLAGDRRYMLVDAEGRFLTQRQHPRMALIRVSYGGSDSDSGSGSGSDKGSGGYRVEAPGLPPLDLPRGWEAGDEVGVTLFRAELEATAVGDEMNRWFSEFLGFDCRLVYMAEHQHRAVPNPAAQFDDEVSFADAAPLLLANEASLAELNSRLAEPVTMRRFRPNVVVDADRPFAEDDWRYLRIGDAEFQVGWPSSRCVLTTVDPETGVKDPGGEPLRTLRGFRRTDAGVIFGQNLIPRRLGRISVGDDVEIG